VEIEIELPLLEWRYVLCWMPFWLIFFCMQKRV